MKTRGIFITGTDTGVGKTYVAAGLVRACRRQGMDIGVMKPVETGCRKRGGQLVPRDARLLAHTAGTSDSIDLVNPYRFRKPLAPSVAAEKENKTIDPKKIVAAFRQLSRKHEYMIVEGAGGIMVPIRRTFTYLDLAGMLKLPVVIVARPGLGTINHTLLTISALKKRDLPIAGFIINYAQDWKMGDAEQTSPRVIREISGVKFLGVLGYGEGNPATRHPQAPAGEGSVFEEMHAQLL